MTACARPILLIEDEEDVRESLRDFLESYGYTILEAENGRSGLDLLSGLTIKPCLVIVDLLMPVMDGFQFLQEVTVRADLSAIPVVVLTSAPERAPASHPVLPKPVDVDALLDLVRKACGPVSGPHSS
jgi:CheY-like chemotaxis protein